MPAVASEELLRKALSKCFQSRKGEEGRSSSGLHSLGEDAIGMRPCSTPPRRGTGRSTFTSQIPDYVTRPPSRKPDSAKSRSRERPATATNPACSGKETRAEDGGDALKERLRRLKEELAELRKSKEEACERAESESKHRKSAEASLAQAQEELRQEVKCKERLAQRVQELERALADACEDAAEKSAKLEETRDVLTMTQDEARNASRRLALTSTHDHDGVSKGAREGTPSGAGSNCPSESEKRGTEEEEEERIAREYAEMKVEVLQREGEHYRAIVRDLRLLLRSVCPHADTSVLFTTGRRGYFALAPR